MTFKKNNWFSDRVYPGYESATLPGRFSKSVLQYLMKIYKGCCGKSESINRVYHALSQYIRIDVTDDAYTFANEAAKLQDLYLLANDYAGELDEVSRQLDDAMNRWVGNVRSGKPNEKQRAEEAKLVAQSALLQNRRIFACSMNEYVTALMNGSFRYEYAGETGNDASALNAFELPLFAHVPVAEDISQDSLGKSKLMQILYNLVEQDSHAPMRMMLDRNDGTAFVRLWKQEGNKVKPLLFVISKRDVYLQKIAYSGEKSLWPGLIETAVKAMDCPQEDYLYALLGPELEKYDSDALLGPNVPAVYKTDRVYNDMVQEYIACYFDAYLSLLTAKSLPLNDTVEYTRVEAAVWEVIYALVCSIDRTFDVIDPAIAFLDSSIAEYKESVRGGSKPDPAAKKRIAICDTLKTIRTLSAEDSAYRSNPRLYFEEKLAARVAGVILRTLKEEETPEALHARTEAVLHSKSFKQQAAKFNIHTMNTASEEYASALFNNLKGAH